MVKSATKKKFPSLDYETFDHNGLEDASGIIKLFKSKNRRVMNIFPDENEEEERRKNCEKTADNETYGLLAESDRLSKAASGPSSSHTSSEKENNPHMKALSPVSIHPASLEDITEPRPQLLKTGKRDNTSLRRSLFNDRIKVTPTEITCSTPMANSRVSGLANSFLQDELNLSPIRNQGNNLKGIEKIPVQPYIERPKIVNVETLASIEEDLRDQFQIDPKTPVKRSRGKSLCSEPMKKSTPFKSSRQYPSSVSASKNSPVVVIEPMVISKTLIKNYQQTQMQRLSVSQCNKTDMRSMNIIEETARTLRNGRSGCVSKKASCNEILSKKLQLCDTSNSQMTEDDDEEEEECLENEAIVPQLTPPTNAVNPLLKSKVKTFDNASLNSSSNKVVPDSVIQSFRDLHRKTLSNEAKQLSSSSGQSTNENQSCRINVPKKVRNNSQLPSEKTKVIEEYLKLGNRKKKSKKDTEENKSKKRTLYSQVSFEEENVEEEEEEIIIPQSPSTRASTRKNLERTESNFHTIFENNDDPGTSENESSANEEVINNLQKKYNKDDQIFLKPSRPGPLKTKQKQQNANKITEKDKINETPKSSRASTGAPKNIHTFDIPNSCSQESSDDDNNDDEVELEKSVKRRGRPRKQMPKNSTQRHTQQELPVTPEKSKKKKIKKIREPTPISSDESEEEQLVQQKSQNATRGQSQRMQVSSDEEDFFDESPTTPEKSNKKNKNGREPSPASSDESQEEEIPAPPEKSNKNKKKARQPSPVLSDESEEDLNQQKSQTSDEEELLEEIPAPREKTNKKNKKVREPSPAASSDESEEEIERVTKKTKTPQKNSNKRKAADDPEKDNAKKPRRRAIYDDEGFESEKDDFDVIYVPKEGRYQLRKRRYARPWWWSGAPSNMRITHDPLTKKQIKAELEIAQLKKRTHINPMTALRGPGAMFMAPTEKLKQLKRIQKEKERANSVLRETSEAPQSKTQTKRAANKKNRLQAVNEEEETESVSVGTCTSIAESAFPTPSEAISHAILNFNKNADENAPKRVVEHAATYDISQIHRLDWVDCANGVCFFGFFGDNGDGMLRLRPGAMKQRARTKNATMKFFVICGEVTFTINNVEKFIKDFGFVVVKPGNYYQISNNSDRDVIINFVRVDTTKQAE